MGVYSAMVVGKPAAVRVRCINMLCVRKRGEGRIKYLRVSRVKTGAFTGGPDDEQGVKRVR